MTTTIKVNCNGNYVAQGQMTIKREGVEDETINISVGPGSNVEKSFNVPHGSSVSISINERNATTDEIEAAAQQRVNDATAGADPVATEPDR